MKTKMLLVLVLVFGLSTTASAATIYYQMTGNLTGSLGGNAFTDALFTFDFIGDTTGVTGTDPLLNPATSTSFLIAGFSAATFSEPIDVGVSPAAGIAGFADATAVNGLSLQNAGFIGWDLASPAGPLTAASPFSAVGTLSTSLGSLVFVDASNLSFTASLTPIPEPAPCALLGMGLAALGWIKLRKRS